MESITGGSAIRSYEYAFSVSSALPHFAALKAARGNPFLFCGLVGWCLEILWTGLHALLRGDFAMKGTTSLLMFPIYGCASLILPVYQKIKNFPVLLRGSLYFTCVPGITPMLPINTGESSVLTIFRSGFLPDCFLRKYLQNLLEKSLQLVYDRSKSFEQ